MIITTSNVLAGVTPTVIFGASSDDPAGIVDEDFSYNYTGSDDNTLTINFGSTDLVGYVAVAGVLVKGSGDGNSSIEILDNGVRVAIGTTKRDHCFLFGFEERVFSNLQIKLFNSSGGNPPTISYAAAGTALTAPNNGEQSGYERQWASRNIRSKTTTSALATPTSSLKARVAVKGSLSLPNVLRSFSGEDWQDFLDFGSENLFFIGENIDKPALSYVCYDLNKTSTKAHGQTRELQNLSINFSVYNGL